MSSESPPILETAECNKLLDTLLNNASTPKKKLKAVRNHCMALLMLLVVPVLGILPSFCIEKKAFAFKKINLVLVWKCEIIFNCGFSCLKNECTQDSLF